MSVHRFALTKALVGLSVTINDRPSAREKTTHDWPTA